MRLAMKTQHRPAFDEWRGAEDLRMRFEAGEQGPPIEVAPGGGDRRVGHGLEGLAAQHADRAVHHR